MPRASENPLTLPYITIQHTLQLVISDVDNGLVEEEDIWLSCYHTGKSSVHGKVKVMLGETSRQVEFKPSGGVEFERNGEVRIRVHE